MSRPVGAIMCAGFLFGAAAAVIVEIVQFLAGLL